MPPPRSCLPVAGLALAGGLLAFGAKLMLIRAYGSDVPYYDEWDAVGRAILLPRAAGGPHFADFVQAQNEHRILYARLIAYGLAVGNGQWDGLVEMTTGAAIHAAFAGALLLFARRLFAGLRFTALALLTLLYFVLPFAWENTLQGIQFQLYLLEWGALGAFLLCLETAPLSPRWWVGWLVAAASLGTMASGFMAAATILILMAARALLAGRVTGRAAGAAALLAAVVAAGLLGVVHVPGHEFLQARTAGQWLYAAASALSWPEMEWPAAFAVLQLPVVLLLWRRLRERRIEGAEAVLLALALWTWIQVAAIAFGRANAGMFRSPRYTDLFAVGSFANAGALGLLWPPTARRRAWSLLALAWIAVFSVGLWTQTKSAYDWSLARFPGFKEAERRHVRAYLATGELAPLKAADPAELPFPRAVPLAGLLDAPSIRELLPMGIRPALPLFPAEGSGGFALAPDGPRPGTSGRVWIARQGPAHFTSEALPSDLLPYLHFEVSGSPELDASAVRIESLGGASHLAPFPLEGDRWHAADADVPAGARARVVVDVPPGAHWLAFTEPVELGRASWADHWLLRRSAWITAAAALLFALALGALAVRDTRQAANRGT